MFCPRQMYSKNNFLVVCGFITYYGLFSCDLHIIDLWWKSALCSQPFVDITPVCTTFMFHDSLMTPQWLMTLLGMPHYDTTMDNDVAMCT